MFRNGYQSGVPCQNASFTKISSRQILAILADSSPIHARGLKIRAARITGSWEWDWQQISYPLILEHCIIEGGIFLQDARVQGLKFLNSRLNNVTAQNLVSEHGVYFTGSEVSGSLNLSSCKINGSLNLDGCRLLGSAGESLIVDGAEITGDFSMNGGFQALGEVRLLGATLGGSLEMDSAHLINLAGPALSANGSKIAGSISAARNFRAEGEVSLLGAHIGNQVILRGARLENATGDALVMDGAVISDSVFLNDAIVNGSVRFPLASIGGQAELINAKLAHPGNNALVGDSASIGGDLLINDGFSTDGSVHLCGVRIGSHLNLDGAQLKNRDGFALKLGSAAIKGQLKFRNQRQKIEGIVDFSGAQVGELSDDESAWPGPGHLILSGFDYGRLEGSAPHAANTRLRWLRLSKTYSPQPYRQLARVLRESDQLSEARDIAIARCDDERRLGNLSSWQKATNIFLSYTISHGYKPGRPALFMLLLFAIAWGLVFWSATDDAFLRTRSTSTSTATSSSHCTKGYPCFSAPAYALENVAPVLNLHQSEYWQPDRAKFRGRIVQWTLYITGIFGWIGTTLFLIAFTGLASRKE
jgi:hypothetical protein